MFFTENVYYYLAVPIAYLLGSIPTGIVAARAFSGVDPRLSGSRNIGATNVGRTAGKLAGIATLIGDAVKGAAPVLVILHLTRDPMLVSLTGLAAFIGHLFPVFLGFRGGKGVATALGVMLVVSPVATLLSAGVFAIVVLVKRYVSLGSMAAASALPVLLTIFPRGRIYVPMAVLISVLIILKHKENIKRLVEGSENRLF